MKQKLQDFNNAIIEEHNKTYDFFDKIIKKFDKQLDVLQNSNNNTETIMLYAELVEVRNDIVTHFNELEILI
jgi:hypothetical protein